MELAYFQNVQLVLFFYSEISKLKTDMMQNIFSLIAEYSGLIKYVLNQID